MELEWLLLIMFLETVWKQEMNCGVMKLVARLFKMKINCRVAKGSLVVNEWAIK